ncbi:ricin-type beta-trefoil lectin domain protein [Streptomyces sp. NPDC058084]|uniref:ricin-type beta-trefoil lectin domain protein n=1 Tax=Streptomyces sp. NPDC058084 TaxID=3346333 RepID=UPI0036EDC172
MSDVSNRRGRRLLTLLAAGAVSVIGLQAGPLTSEAAAATPDGGRFQGVNWADPRDNYADDAVVPTGLSTEDDYLTTYYKSAAVVGQFQSEFGANTVRLPVNPASVNGPWWDSYRGAIDAAVGRGVKVVLGYWEGPGAAKDGRIDDKAAYDAMWRTVVDRYGDTGRVYFEPMNEPFGYSATEWADTAAGWLSAYGAIVPRERVLVGGVGYSEDVRPVCADPRLAGTHLSLHQYGFWHQDWTDPARWAADLRARVGNCASRTVLTEFGTELTTGLDYNGPVNGRWAVATLKGQTDTVRELGIGSVYWPGLRAGDSYSLTELQGTGTDLTLRTTNTSAADRLAWAWWGTGRPATTSGALRGVGSGHCLDVPGGSREPGTKMIIWYCNGKENQQWTYTAEKELRVYGNMCLDVDHGGTAGGTPLILWPCNGGTNQKWNINAGGSITAQDSGLALDVGGAYTAAGSDVGLWYGNGATNQQWQRL